MAVASGGDFGSQDPVARQKARDGEDDYRMHKGRTGIRRFQRLFGYFWGGPKVIPPTEPWAKEASIKKAFPFAFHV